MNRQVLWCFATLPFFVLVGCKNPFNKPYVAEDKAAPARPSTVKPSIVAPPPTRRSLHTGAPARRKKSSTPNPPLQRMRNSLMTKHSSITGRYVLDNKKQSDAAKKRLATKGKYAFLNRIVLKSLTNNKMKLHLQTGGVLEVTETFGRAGKQGYTTKGQGLWLKRGSSYILKSTMIRRGKRRVVFMRCTHHDSTLRCVRHMRIGRGTNFKTNQLFRKL